MDVDIKSDFYCGTILSQKIILFKTFRSIFC
jgi:hypothetical protein